jgi:hypothetical protein
MVLRRILGVIAALIGTGLIVLALATPGVLGAASGWRSWVALNAGFVLLVLGFVTWVLR